MTPFCSVVVDELISVLVEGLKRPSGSDAVSEQGMEQQEEGGDGNEESPGQQSDRPALQVHLTPLELEGLWNLLGKLEALPSNKKCVPAGIQNASVLITHVKVLSNYV